MTRAHWGTAMRTLDEMMELETDECIIWPLNIGSHGYGRISVKGVSLPVTWLVCERAYGPRPLSRMALHSCRDKRCINPRHLSWGTASKNYGEDRLRDGTDNRGERSALAKLTEQQVREMRRDRRLNSTKYSTLGKRYGVSTSQAQRICRFERWAHVTGEH